MSSSSINNQNTNFTTNEPIPTFVKKVKVVAFTALAIVGGLIFICAIGIFHPLIAAAALLIYLDFLLFCVLIKVSAMLVTALMQPDNVQPDNVQPDNKPKLAFCDEDGNRLDEEPSPPSKTSKDEVTN